MGKSIRDSLAGWLRPSHAARPSKVKHGNPASRVSNADSNSRESPRPELVLVDLDAEWTGRRSTAVRRKVVPSVQHVRRYLATRLTNDDDQNPLSPNSIRLFHGQNEIPDNGDDTIHQAERISYQVTHAGPLSSLPQIDLRSGDIELSEKQITHVRARINNGITTRDLQILFQSILDENGRDSLDSHLQIEVRAIGGLRPGPIQGLDWEVRGVVSGWLCQRLAIRVRPRGQHVVIRAFNQEYVVSRPKVDGQRTISVRNLKKWFLGRVMLRVDGDVSRGGTVDINEFLCRDTQGRILPNHSRVACGYLVEMSMSRGTEERFTRLEAWLVPASVICVVCGDDKRLSEMPARITEDCGHQAQTCKDCVGQWIASSLESTAWDRLRCPECPSLLGFHAVAAFAARDDFTRYDTLATRAAMSSIPNFKWCLNSRCDAGQLYSPGCSRARCRSCKHSMCVYHDVPWHKGESCDQYDRRTRKQRKNDKASKKKIKTMTKPCPRCKRNVHKYTGCDHITCICGHEWCYLCSSEYRRNDNGMLRCQHHQNCRYRADPPFFEGGLPFGFRGPGLVIPQRPRPDWDFWGAQWLQRGDMDFRAFDVERERRRTMGIPEP